MTVLKKKTASAPSVSLLHGSFRVAAEIMDSAHFMALPRCLKQRDEEIRAAKHLLTMKAPHLVVAIYRDVDGNESRLDGHTRTYIWEKAGTAPAQLIVIVFEELEPMLDTIGEQVRLYDCYDSRDASKKANDEIQGAMNMLGLKFETPWLRRGTYSNMLAVASAYMPEAPSGSSANAKEARVLFFAKELAMLDRLRAPIAKMKSGTGAGVMMLLKEYGSKAEEVLRCYFNGTGSIEIDGKKNALAMVQSFLELEKAAGLMTGDANNKRQAVRVYQLLETAVSTRSVDPEIARFEPGAYAGRIKRH